MTASQMRARLGALLVGAALAPPAMAQDGGAALRLTLDSLAPSSSACRTTLVVENALGAAIARVAYEFVFFDRDGRVQLLTVLDLKDIPAGRMRVRQFDLPGLDCTGVSRILVNDAKACEGPGIEASACLARLATASKSDVPLEN